MKTNTRSQAQRLLKAAGMAKQRIDAIRETAAAAEGDAESIRQAQNAAEQTVYEDVATVVRIMGRIKEPDEILILKIRYFTGTKYEQLSLNSELEGRSQRDCERLLARAEADFAEAMLAEK